MGNFSALNWVVCIFCVVCICVALFLVPDWAQRILIIIAILMFFLAVQQSYAAHASAKAAKVSAQSAADSHRQATYLHLASLWYQIKQRGLECDDFTRPEFTTLFRQEDALTKYRQYNVYAWMSWGHAEDCYLKGYHTDEGFRPSIENYKEIHYAWLSVPQHRRKFSTKFSKWVDTELLQPSPDFPYR